MQEETVQLAESGFQLEPSNSAALTSIISEEESIDENLLKEAKKLATFLLEQDNGYGIAANQVGLDRRIFVLRNEEKKDAVPEIFINPKITKTYGDKIGFYHFKQAKDRVALQWGEGCLSFPGKTTHIKRYEHIGVEYTDETGAVVKKKLRGFRAVAFQHELDHLDGIVCVEHPDKWEPVWKPN